MTTGYAAKVNSITLLNKKTWDQAEFIQRVDIYDNVIYMVVRTDVTPGEKNSTYYKNNVTKEAGNKLYMDLRKQGYELVK